MTHVERSNLALRPECGRGRQLAENPQAACLVDDGLGADDADTKRRGAIRSSVERKPTAPGQTAFTRTPCAVAPY